VDIRERLNSFYEKSDKKTTQPLKNINFGGISLDLTRNLISRDILVKMRSLLTQSKFSKKRKQLFDNKYISHTESKRVSFVSYRNSISYEDPFIKDSKYGTVGSVAIDINGNISAGTSTGGTTNKIWGRIGDVPIIGAGNYANNECCGISATGWGEHFIRNVVAYDIAAQMIYKNESIKDASKKSLDKVKATGGDGGVIGLDKNGNVAMEFNTAGMYRAHIDNEGNITIKIYKD